MRRLFCLCYRWLTSDDEFTVEEHCRVGFALVLVSAPLIYGVLALAHALL